MPPRPAEGMTQAEVLYNLRFAIETAIAYPTDIRITAALELARAYPRALRSSHVRHNLGQRRWKWLTEHGITVEEHA